MEGETYRDVAGRRTLRVQIGGRFYFLKLHYGVGWIEIVKNWMVAKRPVIGAENEYTVCRDLHALGIPAPIPAAYAASDNIVPTRRSFVMCDELAQTTSLEDVTNLWFETPPTSLIRLRMLNAVAHFAREFHAQGFIHRDFYICHLLADNQALTDGQFSLAVLDLHRARRFAQVPQRWLKRDLAALLFSTLDLNFSTREWLRFLRIYTGRPLRELDAGQIRFWKSVVQRAEKLYQKGSRKGLVRGDYRASAWLNKLKG